MVEQDIEIQAFSPNLLSSATENSTAVEMTGFEEPAILNNNFVEHFKPTTNGETEKDNDGESNECSNRRSQRSGPPKCDLPLLQEMSPLGPPPSYIPNSPTEKREDSDEENSSPRYRIKRGILLHKNSVRDPDRTVKHVTFGNLPRRRGDDPDPCLLVIILIIFLIASISLVLTILVLKGTLKVPCDCHGKVGKKTKALQENQLITSCPTGWVFWGDSCYGNPSVERRNYTSASRYCFQYGAYLVSFESELENNWFVRNIMKPRKEYLNEDEIFIGIKPGKPYYTWESRKPFDYRNNLKGSVSQGFCYSVHSNGAWLPTDCALELGFYCERLMLM